MTAPRTSCAARAIFRDKHVCVDRWYVVTDPEGRTFDLCSMCCVLEYAIWGLPADLEAPADSEGEVAA